MKNFFVLLFLFCINFLIIIIPSYAERNTETIVIVRHGEKPFAGLGQLTCQGLNRALALPNVLLTKFGVPDYIFAPNPQGLLFEGLGIYHYVRPLTTILPLAIQLTIPVNTKYAYNAINPLADELLNEKYHHSLIFIAWEHVEAYYLTKQLLNLTGGRTHDVPLWFNSDYNNINIIDIDWNAKPTQAYFRTDSEGLDGQNRYCQSRAQSHHAYASWGHSKLQFIFIPAAESQDNSHGQLSCQGLNRALNLSTVLLNYFPNLGYYIAAAPADPGPNSQDPYHAALMTLEPTAIKGKAAMETPLGYQHISAAVNYLLSYDLRDVAIAVAWEPKSLRALVSEFYQAQGGNPADIPDYGADHDTMYVVTITGRGHKQRVQVSLLPEGLNNESAICPNPISMALWYRNIKLLITDNINYRFNLKYLNVI